MAAPTMTPGQQALEERYRRTIAGPRDPEKTPQQVYGEMESWMFTLGDYLLFLNPVTGSWFWHDRVHNDLRDLGYPAGTGILFLDGDELRFVRTPPGGHAVPVPEGADQGADNHFCTSCGSPVRAGKQFCGSCGSPAAAGKKFCASCGTAVTPGKKFCGNCGRTL